MKKGKGQLEISTLVKLIIALVVLAVILLFFTGGFEKLGTGKFSDVAQSVPADDPGVGDVMGGIKDWF